jgi:hypothetical protein
LACLAGVLESFRAGADDTLLRFTGVRLSASSLRRVTQKAGAELAHQQHQGTIVTPEPAVAWDFRVAGQDHTVAYLGLDAFSVPIQQPGGGCAPVLSTHRRTQRFGRRDAGGSPAQRVKTAFL